MNNALVFTKGFCRTNKFYNLLKAAGVLSIKHANSELEASNFVNKVEGKLLVVTDTDISRLKWARIIKSQYPDHAKVIIVSKKDDKHKILTSIVAGADGYLLLSVPRWSRTSELPHHECSLVSEFVKTGGENPIFSTQVLITILSAIKDKNIDETRRRAHAAADGLTMHQYRFLKHIAAAGSIRAAARNMGLSVHSGPSIVRLLRRNLDVDNLPELMLKARSIGLI